MEIRKQNLTLGICLADDDNNIIELKEIVKKENDLTDEDLKDYKVANIFKLVENIRYYVFECDTILISKDLETYHHTGQIDTMAPIENKDIIALIDSETGEIERV